MECITCGRDDAFNRVVVNQVARRDIGLFCEDCEREQFGSLLEETDWHHDNGCAFCGGNGKFALPPLECLIETDDGDVRHLEYDTLFDSVQLCGAHLDLLATGDYDVGDAVAQEVEGRHHLNA